MGCLFLALSVVSIFSAVDVCLEFTSVLSRYTVVWGVNLEQLWCWRFLLFGPQQSYSVVSVKSYLQSMAATASLLLLPRISRIIQMSSFLQVRERSGGGGTIQCTVVSKCLALQFNKCYFDCNWLVNNYCAVRMSLECLKVIISLLLDLISGTHSQFLWHRLMVIMNLYRPEQSPLFHILQNQWIHSLFYSGFYYHRSSVYEILFHHQSNSVCVKLVKLRE